MNEYIEKVKKFVVKFSKNDGIGVDDNLFEIGFATSLFVMQLIVFIENEFDIEVDDTEFEPEDFGTITKIAEYVQKKNA